MQNLSHQDPASRSERTPKYDLNRIDYQWIEKTNTLKDLRDAYEELEFDGCFPDLLRVLGLKIAELDP